MTLLSIEVLGPLQVSMAGKPISALESIKVRALLAYLAVESDRAHTRDTLVGLLWPDYTEESARHNLRQALFNLRMALGDATADPPFLHVTREKIQFNRASDYTLDIETFNHLYSTCVDNLPKCVEDCATHASNLEEMVKLYRGEFLKQLAVDDSTEFEDWLIAKREKLHQHVLEAHGYLANYYELHADTLNARQHTTRQLELDPWREEAHRQLMRLLVLDGQRSAALAQYETCRRLLAEELDVEPSMETRQLYEQIKSGSFGSERIQPAGLRRTQVDRLPVQLTPFIGRQAELIQLGEYLKDPECHCLTLVGPGGIGKTRLALQAATTYGSNFTEPAAFISLASIGSVADTVAAIMSALNVSYYSQSDPKSYLLSYLQTKQMILLMDNAEHLLNDERRNANITGLMVEILQAAPMIKLLVTSREALNLQGEFIFDVQGLAYPKSDQISGLGDYDAVTLFIQRARRASPQFIPTEEDQATIAHICRLVEGMPLALELAATWMRVLSPVEIANEIEGSLDFLSSSQRDLPERHRSMRVVFDYSWRMLSQEEQKILCKLSIFRGGFQRQAAEQVAGATLTSLSTLVNRTLLRRTESGRYDLHELVRQYCADQLDNDPQIKKAAEESHYGYFLAFANTSEQELRGSEQLEWLDNLELERDNLRIAFQWALAYDRRNLKKEEYALQLASALRWFWRMHGHFREGCEWLSEALQLKSEQHTRAQATAWLGVSLLINGLGDLSAAIDPAEQAINIFEELHDQTGLAEAWLVEGLTYLWQGDSIRGTAQLESALAIYRAAGDRWGEAHALYRLGSFKSDYGGDATGQVMLETSAAILEELGEKYLQTSVLIALGIIELGHGEFDTAQVLLERSLATTRAIKHPWGIADALTNLGCIYRIRGNYSTAQSLFEEALDVYQKPVSSIWQTDVYCALAENSIAQADFPAARLHLQAATNILGSSENKWLQVVVLYFRGVLAFHEGQLNEAARLLEEDIPFEKHGQFKPDLARSLVALGRVKLRQGEVERARALIHEGIGLFRLIGQKLGVVNGLEALAEVYFTVGEYRLAVELDAISHKQRQAMGAPLPPIEGAPYDSLLEQCKSALGVTLFSKTWENASAQPFEQVVSELLEA